MVFGCLKECLKTTEAVVDGHRMFLDPDDSLDLSINDSYESFERDVMENELKRGGVVLDVGANIGFYTLRFARSVGPEGTVYAFEADPRNFELLTRNIEINDYNNIVPVHKAISNKEGRLRLYLHESDSADHRIFDADGTRRFIEVEATTIDHYFSGRDVKIDFIKMDIQGAEFLALQGMRRILDSRRCLKMMLEFWPYGLEK